MGKRSVALFVVLVLMFGVFLGSVWAAGGKEEAAVVEQSSGPVSIDYWYPLSGSKGEVFKDLVDRFNSSQDKVIVNAIYSGGYGETAEKITAALASKTTPNGGIIPAGPIFTGQYDNYKILDYMKNDKDFDMSDFYDGIWEYAKYKGKICTIPYNISTPIMYYNKDLFKAAGLDPNSPPTTWDELLADAKAISKDVDGDGQMDIWGYNVKDTKWLFKAFLMQNGNGIIDTETKTPLFTEKSGVETAAFWDELIEQKAMPSGLHKVAEDMFAGGQLGIMMASASRISRWNGNTDFEFGAAMLPKGKFQAVPIGGAVQALFPSGNEAEDFAAYTFIKWLSAPENLAEFCVNTGYIPPRKAVLDEESVKKFLDDSPMFRVAFEQLAYATSYWHFNEMGTMDSFIAEALEKMEIEKLSPADSMKWLNDELTAEIKANE